MSVVYFIPLVASPSVRDDFSPTVYPDGTHKQDTWLSAEEWNAKYPLPAPPPPSVEELQIIFTSAIQEHLDSFARTRNYDGIMSAATYATSTVPKFHAEGQYAVEEHRV